MILQVQTLDGQPRPAAMPTTKRSAPSGADFYPTPTWVTEALLAVESFQGRILEPACGDGAVSKVLKSAGYAVESSDLYDRGFGVAGRDFLLPVCGGYIWPIDNIVTNPPYGVAEKFVLRALEITRHKVAFFLRLAFLESITRHKSIFSQTPPARVWVFSERVTMYPSGKQTAGGGTTAYAWFVWDRQADSGTQLGWIPPGSKPKTKKREMPDLGLRLADLGLAK